MENLKQFIAGNKKPSGYNIVYFVKIKIGKPEGKICCYCMDLIEAYAFRVNFNRLQKIIWAIVPN
jgi:hypothetical protein